METGLQVQIYREAIFSPRNPELSRTDLRIRIRDFELKPTRLGIVELVKVMTKGRPADGLDESPIGDKHFWAKQKQFIKMIRDEWRYLYSE